MSIIRCLGCMSEYDSQEVCCPYCSYMNGEKQPDLTFLPLGVVLYDRYTIGKALGSSDFGVTYIAWDNASNCKVVIKEYYPRSLSSRVPETLNLNTYDGDRAQQFENGLTGFLEEASMLCEATADLPGIVRITDAFIENSTGYMVAEYINGVSLDKIISSSSMPWQDVVAIISPVIASLNSLHINGIGSYTIAPDNIILTGEGEIKIASFGGARLKTVGEQKDLGMITKPGFSAEEMYRSTAAITYAADVYSIAAVMYYAITGIRPQTAIDRDKNDQLKSFSKLGIKMPENIENAIMNALNVSPKYRTKTCAQFIAELNSPKVVRVTEPKKKDKDGGLSKKMKAFLVVLVVLGIAAICAIVAVFGSKNLSNKSTIDIGDGTQVVDFVGASYYEAYKHMTDLGWEVTFKRADSNSDGYQPDAIIKQDVPAGSLLDDFKGKDKKIEFIIAPQEDGVVNDVAKDWEWALMPDLVGMDKEEAQKLLEAYGYTNVSFATSESFETEDMVLYQSASVDEMTDKDAEIVLTIAIEPTTAAPQHHNVGNNNADNGNSGNDDQGEEIAPVETAPPETEPEEEVGEDDVQVQEGMFE